MRGDAQSGFSHALVDSSRGSEMRSSALREPNWGGAYDGQTGSDSRDAAGFLAELSAPSSGGMLLILRVIRSEQGMAGGPMGGLIFWSLPGSLSGAWNGVPLPRLQCGSGGR